MMKSIQTRFLFALVATAIAGIICATWLGHYQTRTSLEQTTWENFRKIAEEVHYNVERVIHRGLHEVEAVALRTPLETHASQPQVLQDTLDVFKDIFTIYEDITVVDPSGAVLASTDYRFRGDWTSKPHFQRALEGKTTRSNVHLIPNPNKLVIAFSAPVYSSTGQVAAVVTNQLNMNLIGELVGHVRIGTTGYAFLVDEYNRLIGCPNEESILEKVEESVLQYFENNTPSFRYHSNAAQQDYLAAVSYSDTKYSPAEGWKTVVVQQRPEVLAPLRQLLLKAMLSLSVLTVVVVFIGIRFARSITRPLLALTEGARQLGAGNLSQRVAVTNRDEVGMLAEAFNQMADNWQADLSARQQAEKALRESEHKYRDLVHNANSIILRLDNEGKIVFFNEYAESLFGFKSSEILGRNCVGTIVPEVDSSTHDLRTMIQEMLTDPAKYAYNENENITSDGRRLWVAWTNRPLLDDHGQLIGALCIGTNITEKRRLEEEQKNLSAKVQQTQKLESLGVLSGGIAHDFNNLLMGILGNADLALMEISPMSPVRDMLNSIQTTAQRAAELCRQMLAYSGRGRFLIEIVDLNELVREMSHLLEVSINKNVVLKYRFEENLPPIRADITQLRQIVMNLITNASDAIGDRSGLITITTSRMNCDPEYLKQTVLHEDLNPGEYVMLEVSDNGCGMDAETQARIFDPFFTTKFTGRGLGLAAALGIVRGHQGSLKVYSEVGKGTTFKVMLPASKDTANSDTPSPFIAAKPQWRGTGIVLLVDDEETVREVGSLMLSKAGFTPLVASDGLEALEIFREKGSEIIAVVLDLTMPHMNGEETFRELRRLNPEIGILLSSGYNEQEISDRFVGRHNFGFVQKPYQYTSLLGALHSLLSNP